MSRPNEIRKQRQEIAAMLAKKMSAATVVAVRIAQADDTAIRAMAEQWLKDEVGRQSRTEVREIERQVFQAPKPAPKISRAEIQAARRERDDEIKAQAERRTVRLVAATRLLDSLLPLLDKPLAVGDGRPVTWGEASRDDFHKRREMLTAQADGIVETVGFVDQALGILLSTGAKCLNDLRRDEEAA